MDQERKTLEHREHVWGGNIYLNTGGRYCAQFANANPNSNGNPNSNFNSYAHCECNTYTKTQPNPPASPYPSTAPVASRSV